MVPRYLLDTNICIYIAKHNPPKVRQRFEAHSKGELAVSVVSFGELRHSAEKSQAKDKNLAVLARLCEALRVLELPVDAGARYGEIRAALESRGQPIGNNDLWIAAHALAADLVVVTHNVRELARVDGLKVENWAD